jgi:hypothetical protein
VERLLELHEADLQREIREVAFDHWWNSSVLATRRYMAICELLEPQASDVRRG